jgi:hypothetical protein
LADIVDNPALARQLADSGRQLAERYSPAAMCCAYEQLLA